MRFIDKNFGFMAERIVSDFPMAEDLLPPKSFRNKRVSVDTKNMAFPCGGGKPGTIMLQATKVDAGFRVPEFAINFFCNRLAQDFLDNTIKCVKIVDEPGSPWNERLSEDPDGFYKELAQVDEAAAHRAAYSVAELPGPEIFDRPKRVVADKDAKKIFSL